MHVYFASPAFSQAERQWNSKVAQEMAEIGHRVYLPQRDNLGDYPDVVFTNNVAELKSCQMVVAVLDRADVDSGVSWVCGFAKGIGKSVFGLRTDSRRGGDDPRYEVNTMLSCGTDVVINSMDELWTMLKSKV